MTHCVTLSRSLPLGFMQAEYATDVVFRRQSEFKPLYENIVRSAAVDVKTEQIEALAMSRDWARQARNPLLFGTSGVGKTDLAAAIGHGLIERGVRVRHYTTTALVQQLQQAREQLELESALQKLDKYRVLILDDFGYVKKSDQKTYLFFELIAHRYETGSIITTSNQPFSEWDRIFPDEMMTVAAIDLLVHDTTLL